MEEVEQQGMGGAAAEGVGALECNASGRGSEVRKCGGKVRRGWTGQGSAECREFGRRGALLNGQTVEVWATAADWLHPFETRAKKEVELGSEDAVVRGPINSTRRSLERRLSALHTAEGGTLDTMPGSTDQSRSPGPASGVLFRASILETRGSRRSRRFRVATPRQRWFP